MAFPLGQPPRFHPKVRPLDGRNHAEPGGVFAAGLRLQHGALPSAAGGGHVLRGDVP